MKTAYVDTTDRAVVSDARIEPVLVRATDARIDRVRDTPAVFATENKYAVEYAAF